MRFHQQNLRTRPAQKTKEMDRTIAILTAMLLILGSGCTTTRKTDTARTGIEQLLISNAVDQTLSKMAMPPVNGRKVFLDAQYLDCVDKGYVVASVRQKLLDQGAHLVAGAEGAEVTIEIRAGALGTDNVNQYVGVPSVAVPGVPLELPEVKVWERNSQYGTAKIGLVALETETGKLIFDSGRPLSRADDSHWAVMGIGPFRDGTVYNEVQEATEGTDFTARVAKALNHSGSATQQK